jgi:WD40 repeat protein
MTHRAGLITALVALSLTAPLSAQEPRLREALKGSASIVIAVAYSPDGKVLAAGGSHVDKKRDFEVHLWDTATNKQLNVLTMDVGPIHELRFSPNGKVLAIAASFEALLWDVAAGKELCRLEGHGNVIDSISFNPDGKTVATGACDGSVRIWDLKTGKELTRIGNGSPGISYTADGKTLVYGTHPSVIKLWDVATGKERAVLKTDLQQFVGLATSPDNKLVAFYGPCQLPGREWDETIRLWDMTGEELQRLHGHVGYIRYAAFSPNGKILASSSGDKTVRLWDVETGKQLALIAADTRSVAFSPDGKTLAVGSREKAVKLWDISEATKGR